jgi:hypothetical protein
VKRNNPVTIYAIFEGTSEIQRLVIARAVSGVHIKESTSSRDPVK